ncbi:MAG: 50S ribosomal protein L25/general stress protein Ctc [Pseudomonadota bacterium]
MKAAATFEANSRNESGKGAARALRRQGKIPAIIYGNNQAPTQIALPLKELTLQYRKGSFFNNIVDLNVDGKVVHALPRDVQTHPVTDFIEHADFQRVDKDSIINVMVPVKVLNQDKSIGLKRGGILNIVRHEVELLCKPGSIPTSIEIDILNLDIARSVHIEDVKLPEGATTVIKRNFTLVTIAGRNVKDDENPQAAAAAAAKSAPAKAAAPKKK